MCVDGRCGTVTTQEQEDESSRKLNDVLTETANNIAARLPESIPEPVRLLIGVVMTAQMASEAFDEVAARDTREMVAEDLVA